MARRSRARRGQRLNTLICWRWSSVVAVVAVWLWMGRETGRGRNWARIVSTVLFGAATLELITARSQHPGGYLAHFVIGGHGYSVIPSVFGATVLGLILPGLLWLTGVTVVWLLWRPACSGFFKPQGAGGG